MAYKAAPTRKSVLANIQEPYPECSIDESADSRLDVKIVNELIATIKWRVKMFFIC